MSLLRVVQAFSLGFEGDFEGLVRVVSPEEVGVTDEETFFVVVVVDEPAGDAFGAIFLSALHYSSLALDQRVKFYA